MILVSLRQPPSKVEEGMVPLLGEVEVYEVERVAGENLLILEKVGGCSQEEVICGDELRITPKRIEIRKDDNVVFTSDLYIKNV